MSTSFSAEAVPHIEMNLEQQCEQTHDLLAANNKTSFLDKPVKKTPIKRRSSSKGTPGAVVKKSVMVLERLNAIGPEIVAQRELAGVFRVLNRHVHALLNSVSFAIYLLEPDGLSLELAFANDFGLALPPASVALNNPVAAIARCGRERHEILVDQTAATDAAYQEPSPQAYLETMHIPLMVGERMLGVMVLKTREHHAYGLQDQVIFRTLSTYAAIAFDNIATARQLASTLAMLRDTVDENLELEYACHTLQELSLTDPLTGLRNRRCLVEQMESEITLCLRRYDKWLKNPVSLTPPEADLVFLLVDIDHFKDINNAYGHAAGNAVLVEMRERLQNVSQESDYVVRWGADEFLIVIRETNRVCAELAAERIRAAVANRPFRLPNGVHISKTCSIGFACFPYLPAYPRVLSWNQVVEFADHGLDMAKKGGRNAWAGLYGTEHAQPESVYQGLLRQTGHTMRSKEIKVITSSQTPV